MNSNCAEWLANNCTIEIKLNKKQFWVEQKKNSRWKNWKLKIENNSRNCQAKWKLIESNYSIRLWKSLQNNVKDKNSFQDLIIREQLIDL